MEKNSVLTVQELESMAPKSGLTLEAVPVPLDESNKPTIVGLLSAIHELVAKNPQFIYIPSDSFIIKNASTVVETAQVAHIPVFSATETPIRDEGALLGLVSTYFNVGELAAFKAEQILTKKKTASQIPIESLNRFTYLVNMEAAKKLGVYPPLSVVKIAELVSPKGNVDVRE
jgi:putative ABC transport system substrate-binding protein